jgi:hypothetical protein
MFEYLIALELGRRVPGLEISGYELPEWGLVSESGPPLPPGTPLLENHLLPLADATRYLRDGLVAEVELASVGLRLENIGQATDARGVFVPVEQLDLPVFEPDEIVVNIRAEELLSDPHPDYGLIPLSFIDTAVSASGAKPVFVGQLGNDPYSAAITAKYPDARMVSSRGAVHDFQLLRSAREIVVAVSTFSWLGAWLSEADRIHLPVSGIFDPRQRADLDLVPVDDDRYQFYGFDVRTWEGGPVDLEYVLADRTHPVLSRDELRGAREAANEEMQGKRERARKRFVRQCRWACLRRSLADTFSSSLRARRA